MIQFKKVDKVTKYTNQGIVSEYPCYTHPTNRRFAIKGKPVYYSLPQLIFYDIINIENRDSEEEIDKQFLLYIKNK